MAPRIKVTFTWCLLLLLSLDPCAAFPQRKLNETSKQNGFVHLGHADGVDYYADEEHNMSWYDADQLCKRNSMILAKVMSKNQALLLARTTVKDYWTSARYSEHPSCLVWEDMPHTNPSTDVIDNFNMWGALTTKLFCGAISSNGEKGVNMIAYHCSRIYVYPLCQV